MKKQLVAASLLILSSSFVVLNAHAETQANSETNEVAQASENLLLSAITEQDNARLAALSTRLQALSQEQNPDEALAEIETSKQQLVATLAQTPLTSKKYASKVAKLEKLMLKTEQRLLKQKFYAPTRAALKSLKRSDSDDYARYAYKKAKKLSKQTKELIKSDPSNVEAIAQLSQQSIDTSLYAQSVASDAKAITRIGERDAERFIKKIEALFDHINNNSANPVDLSGLTLQQQAEKIAGKPMVEPVEPSQAENTEEQATAKAPKPENTEEQTTAETPSVGVSGEELSNAQDAASDVQATQKEQSNEE